MKSAGKKNQSTFKYAKNNSAVYFNNINNSFFVLIVILFTCIIYLPVLKNDFLIYDDTEWVTGNDLIRKLDFQHLKLFFITPALYMYAPFVYISFAIDFTIAGLSPFMFHFSNLLFHLLNSILVFSLINQIANKKEIALITAALFAIHPVNTDTVAWISTRSNLLCTFFFLLSLINYLNYLKKNNDYKYYFFCIVFFLFSCLSKSAAVTLPAILLLIDYFKQRKIKVKIFVEKIPFILIGLVFGFIAVYFRNDASLTELQLNYSSADKFFILCYSTSFYFKQLILPLNLSAVYTYPVKTNGSLPIIFYFSPLIVVFLVFVIVRFYKSNRALILGICFFFITIIISLTGFLEDGFVANRYAYMPYIGLYFIVGNYLAVAINKNRIFLAGLFLAVCIFSLYTHQRTYVWKNSITLFDDVIKKQPDNVFGYNSRGIAKYENKLFYESINDYSKAIFLNPAYATAYYNRAITNYQIQNFNEAMNDYTKTIELNPASAKSYLGRGILKMDIQNKYSEAIGDFNKAIELNPDFAQSYYNRGLAHLRLSNTTAACQDFFKVKQLGYSRANKLIEKYCN